jgi:hypothetical protein
LIEARAGKKKKKKNCLILAATHRTYELNNFSSFSPRGKGTGTLPKSFSTVSPSFPTSSPTSKTRMVSLQVSFFLCTFLLAHSRMPQESEET